MHKIIPCLWFDDKAEEAATFYASIFKNSKVGDVTRYGKEGYEIHGREAGTVMTVEFEIEGQNFVALNGGPIFKFNEAISFQVHCETQKEVDYYWEKLSQGGDEQARSNAVGSRTNMESHGKLFPLFWQKCYKTRILRNRIES
jgi:predicted 3-demethylubiquinone-9 3-methyltransferase (glyoxalase superfamily)